MMIKPVFLITDCLLYLLLAVTIIFAGWAKSKPHLAMPWKAVFSTPMGIITATVLAFYVMIALADSMHFQPSNNQTSTNSINVSSVLDLILAPLNTESEKTYSAPYSSHLYTKETIKLDTGQIIQAYRPLIYDGNYINNSKWQDILLRSLYGFAKAVIIISMVIFFYLLFYAWRHKTNLLLTSKKFLLYEDFKPQRIFLITIFVLITLSMMSVTLAHRYHIFGTDKVGQDVFYEAIKSIRTGILIGTLTTLVMLPFALFLGTIAGFYGGILDDIIQYIYTTLSSIPGVLLIAASILSIQIFISNHESLFPTVTQRADARLLSLCIILGISSWTSLCRLLRAETLKLREMDYVQAAKALGVSSFKSITRHIMPNLMHIVIISIVLDFSGLVLAEAVLSYVGVGVDPTTLSWGNMINSARLELAREPIVWWPLVAAFSFMFALVLCANLFSDRVRDAFDPRLKRSNNVTTKIAE